MLYGFYQSVVMIVYLPAKMPVGTSCFTAIFASMITLFLALCRYKKWSSLLAIIWTLLIFVACLLPGNEFPEVDVPFIDKWVHLVIFAGFSFLWLAVWAPATAVNALGIFIAAGLVGYLVECLQGSGWVSGRSYDLMDVIADAVGGLLGIGLFFLLQRAGNKPQSV